LRDKYSNYLLKAIDMTPLHRESIYCLNKECHQGL
jgi:hypothetical protein